MRNPRFLIVLLSSLMLAGCIVPSNGRELKTNYPMDLMEIAYGHFYRTKESPTQLFLSFGRAKRIR